MHPDPTTALERTAVERALAEFEPRGVEVGDFRAAAVAVAIGGSVGDRRMLLTRRPARLRAHPGQFALPGGRIDDGETPEQGCLRELEEELGISASSGDILGRLDDYVTRSGYVISPFVVWVGDYADRLSPSAAEVAVVYEVTQDEIDVDARFITIPESARPVVQWPFRDHLVHAPTGAIVHQFREVVLRGRHTRVAEFEQPVFAWR